MISCERRRCQNVMAGNKLARVIIIAVVGEQGEGRIIFHVFGVIEAEAHAADGVFGIRVGTNV